MGKALSSLLLLLLQLRPAASAAAELPLSLPAEKDDIREIKITAGVTANHVFAGGAPEAVGYATWRLLPAAGLAAASEAEAGGTSSGSAGAAAAAAAVEAKADKPVGRWAERVRYGGKLSKHWPVLTHRHSGWIY